MAGSHQKKLAMLLLPKSSTAESGLFSTDDSLKPKLSRSLILLMPWDMAKTPYTLYAERLSNVLFSRWKVSLF